MSLQVISWLISLWVSVFSPVKCIILTSGGFDESHTWSCMTWSADLSWNLPASCLEYEVLVENGLAHFLPFHGYFILQRQSWVAVTETLWAGAIVFIRLTHFAQSPILYSCILVNIVFFFFWSLQSGESYVFIQKYVSHCKLTSWQSVYKAVCSEFAYISSLCQGGFSPTELIR